MITLLLRLLHDLFRSRRDLLLENLTLRQQILVLERSNPRPLITELDRTFWALLSRLWANGRHTLRIVQPETVIAWHRRVWRFWWRWKSRDKAIGRPRISEELIELIRRMSLENQTWGAPRIHGELLKLGYDVSEATVARYTIKRRGRPTQNWTTFLRNHLGEIAAIDFLTVPTVMFRTLYVFVVLSLGRRHTMSVLKRYLEYYHGSRTHLGIAKDAPDRRAVEPPELGPVRREAMVGGLHSRYYRDAA